LSALMSRPIGRLMICLLNGKKRIDVYNFIREMEMIGNILLLLNSFGNDYSKHTLYVSYIVYLITK
jgi:hypothetical protein